MLSVFPTREAGLTGFPCLSLSSLAGVPSNPLCSVWNRRLSSSAGKALPAEPSPYHTQAQERRLCCQTQLLFPKSPAMLRAFFRPGILRAAPKLPANKLNAFVLHQKRNNCLGNPSHILKSVLGVTSSHRMQSLGFNTAFKNCHVKATGVNF